MNQGASAAFYMEEEERTATSGFTRLSLQTYGKAAAFRKDGN